MQVVPQEAWELLVEVLIAAELHQEAREVVGGQAGAARGEGVSHS